MATLLKKRDNLFCRAELLMMEINKLKVHSTTPRFQDRAVAVVSAKKRDSNEGHIAMSRLVPLPLRAAQKDTARFEHAAISTLELIDRALVLLQSKLKLLQL
jgi:hypothetical protein